MTFTHGLSTNNYGPAKFIVATSAANGTHTTLASAMAAASSGDAIFLRDSVTENVTITPGVNIVGWQGASANMPSITGELTMTGAGTSTISGITLITNSDFCINMSGSNSSSLILENCFVNCTNNTGLSIAGNTAIRLENCNSNLTTTGIALYTMSSSGSINIYNSVLFNAGNSSTASSNSAGQITLRNTYSGIAFSTSASGGAVFTSENSTIDCGSFNGSGLVTSGTGVSNLINTYVTSGSASAVSIGAGTTCGVYNCTINSGNTNAITGAGTVIIGDITFSGTSSLINTTTQNRVNTAIGLQGSWTPTDASGAGLAFSTATGSYIRIGNLVIATCLVVYPATADASAAIIGSLPFTTATGNQYRAGLVCQTSEATLASALTASAATTFQLYTSTGGNVTNATMSTDSAFFQITYQAV